jgi:hypothetical protein
MSNRFDSAFPTPLRASTLLAAGIDYGQRVNVVVTGFEWRQSTDYKSGKDLEVLVLELADGWPEWHLKAHQGRAIGSAVSRNEAELVGSTISVYVESTLVGDTIRIDQKRCKKAAPAKSAPPESRQKHSTEKLYDTGGQDDGIAAMPNEDGWERGDE